MVDNVNGFRGVQAPQRRAATGPLAPSNGDYVKGLYKELLGREPDLDGYHAHMQALDGRKVTREQLRDIFLDSPEFKERLAKLNKLEADANAASTGGVSPQAFIGDDDVPLPPGAPAAAPGGPAAGEPGAPLATVPLTARMKQAADAILAGNPGLKNDPGALTKAVAAYVKDHNLVAMPVGDDRAQMYKVMTEVIGIIRSMGVDAFRVVNHPSRPEGDPGRYGSDALVINGRIFDVYRAFGEASEPVDQDVGPWNQARAKGLRE